jgi:hypothetical protein
MSATVIAFEVDVSAGATTAAPMLVVVGISSPSTGNGCDEKARRIASARLRS